MNSVNKTLYIPLYGRSYVSKQGLFLNDKKSEQIWESENFLLKRKSKSKWLAYYIGIRSAVFDEWVKNKMANTQNAVVIHIGCGMDSRVLRVGSISQKWYDLDFAEVITQRKQYYHESANYQMIAGDVRNNKWLTNIHENKYAIVVMEGVSMYLTSNELHQLILNLCTHFKQIAFLMDCYTVLAAKISKHRNPIYDVGISKIYGIDNPRFFQYGQFVYVKEHIITPQKYINELTGIEKYIFKKLYAGSFSKKLYRLFEYKKI